MKKEKANQPWFDAKGKEIAQVGIVVRDASATAQRYSEIFGIGPWTFMDMVPKELVLHDKEIRDVESCARLALANLSKMQIELIQPLYGPSTYMDFLKNRGEGIHHLSFGIVDDHDDILSSMTGHGIGIEMQGLLGEAYTFTYMATQEKLGTIFEAVKPPPPDIKSNLKPWGIHESEEPSIINLNGKEIVQVGIVVEDVEETAKNYWDIFGIGPWILVEFNRSNLSSEIFHGIVMKDVEVSVKAGIANLGDIQIELLEPVIGTSTHMEFLKIRGEGIHHVSFGEVVDHDEIVSKLKEYGIGIESAGLLGGSITFTYMATQKDLGTIYELVKTDPDVENTIKPYGTYPPS